MAHAIFPRLISLPEAKREGQRRKTDMQYFCSTEDAGLSQPDLCGFDMHAISIFLCIFVCVSLWCFLVKL